jgi:hypothetical protein
MAIEAAAVRTSGTTISNATTLHNIASGTPVSRSTLTSAVGEFRRDGDREAAAGDRQADEDHDVGQVLVPGEERSESGFIDESVSGGNRLGTAFSSCVRPLSTAAVDPFVPTTSPCTGNAASASG